MSIVRALRGLALIAHQDDDGSICLYTQEGKPLLRQEFTDLVAQASRWYETHTDEDIQYLCDESDEYHRKINEILRRDRLVAREKKAKSGVVYILKCGAYHKIGKSIDYPTRKIQLDTQLPQVSELIHTIPTNEPAKLERQLHRRFQEKRLNGEWFDLSAADVAALKTL